MTRIAEHAISAAVGCVVGLAVGAIAAVLGLAGGRQ